MKRKSWISSMCGGLLLISLATPAAAAVADGTPGVALLARVMSWIESWTPIEAPGTGLESETLAGEKDIVPAGGAAVPVCEPCNNQGEMDGTIDPDG